MVKKNKASQINNKAKDINKKINKKLISQVDKPSIKAQVLDKKIELRKEKELPVVTKIDKGVDSKKIEVGKNKEVKAASKSVFSNKFFFKLVLFFLLGLIIGLSVSILAINKEIERIKELTSLPIAVELGSAPNAMVDTEVIQKVQLFIKDNLINETDEIKLLESEEVSGLYKVNFAINGNPVSLHATRDGEYIILPGGIKNIEEWAKELNVAQEEAESRAEEELKCEKFQAELNQEPERKVKIAQCLAEKGYKLYYTDWCPFCRDQKGLFGEAAEYLITIDCYDPEGRQNNIDKCPDLQGVPAWRDKDGNKLEYNDQIIDGLIQIRRLVEVSGCHL